MDISEGPTVVGCDDGEIRKVGFQEYTTYACVSMDSTAYGLYPRDAALGLLRVDGLEASSVIAVAARLLEANPVAVILDSITIAGFNVVSPPIIYRLVGAPVIVVYSYKPSYARLRRGALNLSTFKIIDRIIRLVDNAVPLKTRKGVLYALLWGIEPPEAIKIVEKFQIHSRVPEPVRVAHYIASAASRLLRGCLAQPSSRGEQPPR
ncbi:MAG: DUF99 family protein [Desulfurococcales archaeon]|nr:DUF99 family protein [Desulfurococcales archaeon]